MSNIAQEYPAVIVAKKENPIVDFFKRNKWIWYVIIAIIIAAIALYFYKRCKKVSPGSSTTVIEPTGSTKLQINKIKPNIGPLYD